MEFKWAPRVLALAERLQGVGRNHRRLFLVAAAALFVVGLVWSFSELRLQHTELHLAPALVLLFLFGPISVIYGALGLWLLGFAAGVPLAIAKALRVDAYAQLAEALPVPGGAIVRTGALMTAGGRALESSALVIASAVLWVAVAAAATGAAVLSIAPWPGAALLSGGIATAAPAALWLASKGGWRLMALTLVHRSAGLLINALRLQCAFAILAVAIPLPRCMPFALATIAGSAASIAPAGVGISETLSAVIASSLGVAAAAGFLAVALNRLLALLAAGIMVLACELTTPSPAARAS